MFGPTAPTLTEKRRRALDDARNALSEVFPHLRLRILASDGSAVADGPIPIDIGAGEVAEVEIRIVFPSSYPEAPFRVYDVATRWKPDPDRHIEEDSKFCLWLDRADAPDLSKPEALAYALKQLVVFLFDQFRFDDIGVWPTDDWEHGIKGYAQHLNEVLAPAGKAKLQKLWPAVCGDVVESSQPCPCGSRKPYGRCHKSRIDKITWIGTRNDADQILGIAMRSLDDQT